MVRLRNLWKNRLRNNEDVKTCIIASCITEEVKTRMETDSTISKYFNLTEAITHEDKRKEFLDYVFEIILN